MFNDQSQQHMKLFEEIKGLKDYEFSQLKNEITGKVENLEKENEKLLKSNDEMRTALIEMYKKFSRMRFENGISLIFLGAVLSVFDVYAKPVIEKAIGKKWEEICKHG